jgi:hypothetical protein
MQDRRHLKRPQPAALYWIPAAILATVAIGYPVWRGLIAARPEIDFRYFWFAGLLWDKGIDPYSASYAELGRTLLPPGNGVLFWPYPPQWWVICRALAAFDITTALFVWRVTLATILILSTAAVSLLLTRALPPSRRALLTATACALATTMEASSIIITSGEVSPVLIYLGIALICCAQLRPARSLLVAGLVLVSLKPQVGIVFFLAFALARQHQPSVLIAALSSAVLALPQLISFGVLTTIDELMGNLGRYNHAESNGAIAMTGLCHLLARAGVNSQAAIWIAFGCAIAAALAAGLMLRREPQSLRALAVLVAAVAALMPLHTYDMIILLLLVTMLLKLERRVTSRLVIIACFALVLRPMGLERLFSVDAYDQAAILLYSLSAMLLLGVAIYGALQWRERTSVRLGRAAA